MPKRTNEFQKLVLLVNEHLSPLSATVTESKMLWERESNIEREIDILIENNIDPYSTLIGIECTAQSRKVSVNQLAAFLEKHKNVGIHKTVVVAKNGFSKPAINFAENRHVELITFDGAFDKDWSDIFNDLKTPWIATTKHDFENLRISYKKNSSNELLLDENICVRDSGVRLSLSEYLSSVVEKNPFEGLRKLKFGVPLSYTICLDFDPHIIIVDKNGIEAYCDKVKADCTTIWDRAKLDAGVSRYKDKEIFRGVSREVGEFESVEVLVTKDRKITFSVWQKN